MPVINFCAMVPDLILCENLNEWNQYEDKLYQIFKADFVDNTPYYYTLPVKIRRHPLFLGREEAFYHITCNHFSDIEERQPDLERCARICWVRYLIENDDCSQHGCAECDGILIWEEPKGETKRIHILLEVERYIVVLEKREGYYLLITAYFIEHNHSLRKLRKRYEQYSNL